MRRSRELSRAKRMKRGTRAQNVSQNEKNTGYSSLHIHLLSDARLRSRLCFDRFSLVWQRSMVDARNARNARNPQPRVRDWKKKKKNNAGAASRFDSYRFARTKFSAERDGVASRLTLRSCFVPAPRSEFTSPFGDLLRHRRTGSFGFGVLISWTDSLSHRLSLRRDGDAWETKGIGSHHSARAKPEHCCRRQKRDGCELVPDAGERKQPSVSP